MEIGSVAALFKLEASRSRGDDISEFKIARLYVDVMWEEIKEMLDSGMKKADVVGMLMVTSRVSRSTAYNTLTNKMNSRENRTASIKEKSKTEVSTEGILKKKPSHAPVVVPAPAQVADPVVPTAPAEIAASTQSSKEPDEWEHLRKTIIIGKGFIGEESKWMTPEEIQEDKDRRARIEKASIASGKLIWK